MFADMELGTKILVGAVLCLILFFGIKGGRGNGNGSGGGSSSGGSSTPPTPPVS